MIKGQAAICRNSEATFFSFKKQSFFKNRAKAGKSQKRIWELSKGK
jgi:hypothetical protein